MNRSPTRPLDHLPAAELRALRESLSLTPTSAAASIGVSSRTWQRWEAGERPMPAPMVRLFRLTHGVKP